MDRSKIYPNIVGNKKSFKIDYPHRKIEDLALTCVQYEYKDNIIVYAEMLREDHSEIALRNFIRKYSPRFITEKDLPSCLGLTTNENVFGAVYLAIPEVLDLVYDTIGEDFYILPSSIHELITMPKSYTDNIEALSSIIKSVNAEYVDEDIYLSDHPYIYLHEKGIVRSAI